jgi:hypothetical protein
VQERSARADTANTTNRRSHGKLVVLRRTFSSLAIGLLAGCAAGPRLAVGEACSPALVPPAVLRIGLEHLAPEGDDLSDESLRVAAAPDRPLQVAPRPASARPQEPLRLAAHAESLLNRHAWTLDAAELRDLPGPFERETLRFLDDLLIEDRKSAEREVRMPFLDWQAYEPIEDPLLATEFAQRGDREEWLADNGPALLRRPLKKLLRRLPLARDVEVAIDDLRAENVPLSGPYQEAHDRRAKTRVSMRLRADNWSDPVELAVVHRGLRVSSAQEYWRMSWNVALKDDLELAVRTRRAYDGSESTWRCDLIYRLSGRTSYRLAVGQDLEFLSTSSVFAGFDSPLDGNAGIAFYAVHVF